MCLNTNILKMNPKWVPKFRKDNNCKLLLKRDSLLGDKLKNDASTFIGDCPTQFETNGFAQQFTIQS